MGWISPRAGLGFCGIEVLLAMRLIVSMGVLSWAFIYMSLTRTRIPTFLLADDLPHTSWILWVRVGAKGFGIPRFWDSGYSVVLIFGLSSWTPPRPIGIP